MERLMRNNCDALERLQQVVEPLKEFTKKCNIEMHEPDEQGIGAQVVGNHLDNASGYEIREEAVKEGYQEFVVILTKDGSELKINLADLIALARLADTSSIHVLEILLDTQRYLDFAQRKLDKTIKALRESS
jgi:hypothetical protein